MQLITKREGLSDRRVVRGREIGPIVRSGLPLRQTREGGPGRPFATGRRPSSHSDTRLQTGRILRSRRGTAIVTLKTDECHLTSVILQHGGQVSGIAADRRRWCGVRGMGIIRIGLFAMIAIAMMMVEVDVRYQMVLAYAAHDRLPHLPPLVPYSLEDADGDRRQQTGHEQEEGGIDVGESGAVEGRGGRATRHLRQHPLGYTIQHAALLYTQYTANHTFQKG